MEYQTKSEFDELAAMYAALPERRMVLEIGSMFGDTLQEWMARGERGMKLVSVDKLLPPSDGRHERQREGHQTRWPQAAKEHGVSLTVIDGYSQAPETVASVRTLLPYLDFLFIDGGHDYQTVKADYENYAPLVRPGGLIALHDIQGIADVARFWSEIKAGKVSYEICAPNGWGIGAIRPADTRPLLHVVTPCSRAQNLPRLAESLLAARPFFRVQWWLVRQHATALPGDFSLEWPDLKITDVRIPKGVDCVGGKAQINAALDRIKDGWVWVLDDDNVAHRDFFAVLRREMETGQRALCFAQRDRAGQVRPAAAHLMRECSVDQAQFVVRRDLVGNARYLQKYTGDGEFAERLHREYPGEWKFCADPVTYYNWLKP